ncbi:hypothetical protein V6N13_088483 [Hibiscus sabdariffa]|uniref:Uncharacterized protein n=1 Tax=Hibiscus sabdariffa TaxID=183260 RepID=A0ABR2FZG0_9ROSI
MTNILVHIAQHQHSWVTIANARVLQHDFLTAIESMPREGMPFPMSPQLLKSVCNFLMVFGGLAQSSIRYHEVGLAEIHFMVAGLSLA